MADLNDKILSVFKSMINDIMEVYPENKGEIYEKYESIMNLEKLDLNECELLKSFMNNINKNSSKITNKDEEAITDELIDGIQLKKIWESDISDKTKNDIWKYLQTFCIININLNSSEELQKLLSGEAEEISGENRKDLKDLKKMKILKESIEEINIENKSNDGMNGMNDIFENTGIGKLAKEIAEGINFEEMMGNMNNDNLEGDATEQNMENIMQNIMNPGNFMNLFQNINEKVQDKINTGSLSEEMLTGEAEKLYGDFQDNPMFNSMMNNPELKKFQKEMNKQSNDKQSNDKQSNDKSNDNDALEKAKKNKEVRVEKLDHKEPVIPKNKTQERLQKKLANKQKEEKAIKLKNKEKTDHIDKDVVVKKTE